MLDVPLLLLSTAVNASTQPPRCPAIGTSIADAKVGAWSISSRRLRTLVCVESSLVAFIPL